MFALEKWSTCYITATAVHNKHIVHADIKGVRLSCHGLSVQTNISQGNVLVADDGVARLCDFGFSAILVEHSQYFTEQTSMKGTCRWMAPELFEDDDPKPTIASDIWACGCLFIEVSSVWRIDRVVSSRDRCSAPKFRTATSGMTSK